MTKQKRVGVLTGGGDAPGLNPAIKGLVYRGSELGLDVVGLFDGWRGLMKTIRSSGKIVVTNHNEPEAVILSAEEYADLMRSVQQTASQTEVALAALRQRFDQRLSALQPADAGDRLRDVMRAGARLEGKVKAGASH